MLRGTGYSILTPRPSLSRVAATSVWYHPVFQQGGHMISLQVYFTVAIVAVAAVVVLLFLARRKAGQQKLTPLAGLAFAFVLAGLFFGERRTMGYGLIAVGVALAIVDMVRKTRSR